MENIVYNLAGEHGLNERKVVGVSSGICPCGPSKKVRAAIRKAVRDVRFSPGPSLARLRRTISSKLGIDGDCLIFANSVEEILFLVSEVFKPEKVLASGPLLDVHSAALSFSGAEIECCGPEAKPGAAESGEAGLVFISQPNRITGRLADRGWMGETLNARAARNNLIVVDESLIEFTGDQGNCDRAAGGQGVIVLRSTVNFYALPGLGLAYAVSSPEIIRRLDAKRHCEVNTLAAAAARAAVADRTYIKTARKYISDERNFLMQSLKKIVGITCHDSDSNVFLMKTARPVDEISGILAKQGFMMTVWKTSKESAEIFFRVSVMEHEKNVKFLKILRKAAGIEPGSGGSVGD